MIENAITLLLNANAGVQTHFGTPARVFPDIAPEVATYPLANFFRVDQSPFSGIYADSVWARARVQVTTYAPSRLAARLAATEIRNALSRIHQTTAAGGVLIDDSVLIQERDSFAADPHPAGFAAVELDFEFTFREE